MSLHSASPGLYQSRDSFISRNSADYRWRDDVWTMKYLSGFKWEMLGEQVGTSPSLLPISRYPVSSVP